jgi:GcrA cell cycle regulator
MENVTIATWTEERIEALKTLWPHHTSRQIAAKIGVTRNSVIGKAARLGLTMEHKAEIHPQTNNKTIRLLTVVRKNVKDPTPEFKQRCVEIVPRHLTIHQLEANDCRYPAGGDKAGDPITFCGHSRKEGSSYCDAHHNLTRNPLKPYRAMRVA